MTFKIAFDLEAAFRADWAKTKHTEYKATKQYSEKHIHVDVTKGTYEPFGWIVHRQGGGKDMRAQNLISIFLKLRI